MISITKISKTKINSNMEIENKIQEEVLLSGHHHRRMVKAFYACCNGKGITTEEKMTILASYGREHTSEMTADELKDAIDKLNEREDTEQGARSKWVRRAMAVTYQYLIAIKNPNINADYVKNIIITSAKVDKFSDLTKQQLMKAFYTFKHKTDEARRRTNTSSADAAEEHRNESERLQKEEQTIQDGD